MTEADARLLAEAYADHAAACRLYARSLAVEDDAQQEAFVRLARHLAAGRAMPDHPRAWLLTATRSAALDARRNHRRRLAREAAAFKDKAMFEQSDSLDTNAVERALAQLAPRQREAVVLRLWCDCDFKAIGELTGVAASTAHADYAAGIDELRRLLGEAR